MYPSFRYCLACPGRPAADQYSPETPWSQRQSPQGPAFTLDKIGKLGKLVVDISVPTRMEVGEGIEARSGVVVSSRQEGVLERHLRVIYDSAP